MNVDGVSGFVPTRLVLARERRGLTQSALSEKIEVSARMIKAYEAGDSLPSAETLAKIARALDFPAAFFEGPPLDPLLLEAASFRALTKASAMLRKRVVAAGTIAMELHRFLAERFDLPVHALPDQRWDTPAAAAEALRHQWGLGQKPIGNVIHLLELHGVRIFSLSEDCEAIDAFSIWRDGTPFIFLNTRKTAERSAFDAAHELGHLVLHRHGIPQGHDAEQEADTFASNFLLPEHGFRATAPRLATIATLSTLKQTWRVSVSMLGRRMHQLGLMSDWHYRQFNIELSRRGRANEPAPFVRDTSAILKKSLAALAEEGVTLREIARELRISLGEVRSLTFGPHALDGGNQNPTGPRGSLKLIERET